MSERTTRQAAAIAVPIDARTRLRRLLDDPSFQPTLVALGAAAAQDIARLTSATQAETTFAPSPAALTVSRHAQQAAAEAGLRGPSAVAFAAAINAAPLVVAEQPEIAASLARVVAAPSVAAAHAEATGFLRAAQAAHQQAFVGQLSLACQAATAAVGFTTVTVRRSGSTVIIAGKAPSGRQIVTEIRDDAGAAPVVETEILGGSGDCHAKLEQFDEALAEQGVRLVDARNHPTWGVPHLESARLLAAQEMQAELSPAPPQSSTTPDAGVWQPRHDARQRQQQ
jgi:hypothetical protein